MTVIAVGSRHEPIGPTSHVFDPAPVDDSIRVDPVWNEGVFAGITLVQSNSVQVLMVRKAKQQGGLNRRIRHFPISSRNDRLITSVHGQATFNRLTQGANFCLQGSSALPTGEATTQCLHEKTEVGAGRCKVMSRRSREVEITIRINWRQFGDNA